MVARGILAFTHNPLPEYHLQHNPPDVLQLAGPCQSTLHNRNLLTSQDVLIRHPRLYKALGNLLFRNLLGVPGAVLNVLLGTENRF